MKIKCIGNICLALAASFFLTACSSSEKVESKSEPVAEVVQLESLQTLLNAQKETFEQNAPPELIKLFNDGVTKVATSGVLESALKKGAKAPDFELPNTNGEMVRLTELLTDGPVILTWYRGGWCPYCNLQLNAYNDVLNEFESRNGQLVAISPEIPDSSLSTSERNSLEFEVLSDAGNKVAKKYGLAYTLPKELADFMGSRVDFQAYYNDKSYALPLGVTYVIDTDRTIVYAFVDGDYKKRAEPSDIITALESLKP